MVVRKPIALMEEQKLHAQIKYTVAWCKWEHAHGNVDELEVRTLLLLFAVGLSFFIGRLLSPHSGMLLRAGHAACGASVHG